MRNGRVTAIILTLLILSGCTVKTHEDTVEVEDEVVRENAQEHNSETIEKHETVIEEITTIPKPKTEQSEEPEEDFPYIRLNLDDTKPVSGVAPVQYNGKDGIINSNGKIIATPKYHLYDYMYINNYMGLDDDFTVVACDISDKETEVYDFFGHKLSSSKYVLTFLDRDGNEAFGYFKEATAFSEGLAVVADASGTYHTLNKDGEILSSFVNASYKVVEIHEFHDGRARFEIIDKGIRLFGYLNDDLSIAIEPKYVFARNFSEGLALVSDGEKQGYIDVNGELIIDLSDVGMDTYAPESGFLPYYFPTGEYDGWDFSDGLAYVCLPRDYEKCPVDNLGYFYWETDENGKIIYDRDHYASLPYGYYIDKNGNKVLEDVIGTKFVHGLAAACDPETGKCGYIDKTGKFVIEPQFELAYPFNESGIAMVSKGETGKYIGEALVGYINTKGEIVIPIEYIGSHMPPFDFESCGIVNLLKEHPDITGTVYYFDKNGTVLGTIASDFYK